MGGYSRHPVAPRIPAVAAGVRRPFWSVMIPNYNSHEYLEQTLKSVLDQDPGPEEMQIELIDNCSRTSEAEQIANRVGKGRVGLFRQPAPVPVFANWNTCVERANGQWVHILHSDDYVLPGFYEKLRTGIQQSPQAGAAFCRPLFLLQQTGEKLLEELELPEAGVLPRNWNEKLMLWNRIQCPCIVVRRDAYTALGGFRLDMASALDWEMWARVVRDYPIWYEPEPLAHYRIHASSITKRLLTAAQPIRDARTVIRQVSEYLPPEKAASALKAAMLRQACTAVDTAGECFKTGKGALGIRFVLEALRSSLRPFVFRRILSLAISKAKM